MPTVVDFIDYIINLRGQIEQARQIVDAQNKKIAELEKNNKGKNPK